VAPDVTSLALLPVVLVCVDAAEFVAVLSPVVVFWLQDELSLSLHGFAIA
jgi:hypothetical protein